MKTLEHRKSKQIKSSRIIGKFASIQELSDYKTNIVNEKLAKITNFNEFFNADGTRK